MSLAVGLPSAVLPHRGRRAWAPAGVLKAFFGALSPAASLREAPEEAVATRRSRFRLLRGGQEPEQESRPTLTELYHAQRLGLVRLAVLLVDRQDVAEDVVQDAFTALFQKHGERLDDLDNALGYLRTSVVNGARSVLRRRKTAREYVPPHETDAPSAEEHAVLNDEHRRVVAALQQLTERQREVLVLRYWSDLSEAQIAETLGLSRGAVKSTASRALDALEKQLEKTR
ncbi:SigE family RNA polymerase sigma factor [Kitasatospora sp. RB6PN24]|uniref:RNA polymerase sigma factor n=1 Tax=Kitasatospora humi TaxID=2893891 RepID=UPI001E5C869B|nr:SigE family RNA polymerase sigma factor [Kitasatospora humi]MCC9309406.1 SigE family RNA polymerase sigma factor [Kitasatospora humi]